MLRDRGKATPDGFSENPLDSCEYCQGEGFTRIQTYNGIPESELQPLAQTWESPEQLMQKQVENNSIYLSYDMLTVLDVDILPQIDMRQRISTILRREPNGYVFLGYSNKLSCQVWVSAHYLRDKFGKKAT